MHSTNFVVGGTINIAAFKLCTAWSSSLQNDSRTLEVEGKDMIAFASRRVDDISSLLSSIECSCFL